MLRTHKIQSWTLSNHREKERGKTVFVTNVSTGVTKSPRTEICRILTLIISTNVQLLLHGVYQSSSPSAEILSPRCLRECLLSNPACPGVYNKDCLFYNADFPQARTTKPVQHTEDIFSLSGLNEADDRNHAMGSHDGGYQLGERVHVFAAYDQSQTWSSLLAAERHILRTKSNCVNV